jgi:hypothetical protein
MPGAGACRARERFQPEDTPADSPTVTPASEQQIGQQARQIGLPYGGKDGSDVVNLVNWLRAEEELRRELEDMGITA